MKNSRVVMSALFVIAVSACGSDALEAGGQSLGASNCTSGQPCNEPPPPDTCKPGEPDPECEDQVRDWCVEACVPEADCDDIVEAFCSPELPATCEPAWPGCVEQVLEDCDERQLDRDDCLEQIENTCYPDQSPPVDPPPPPPVMCPPAAPDPKCENEVRDWCEAVCVPEGVCDDIVEALCTPALPEQCEEEWPDCVEQVDDECEELELDCGECLSRIEETCYPDAR